LHVIQIDNAKSAKKKESMYNAKLAKKKESMYGAVNSG
jgi:hypothetical protein